MMRGLVALVACCAVAQCDSGARCPERSDCPTLAVGTIEQIRGDTLLIVSGVGLALRLDTVVLRPGLIVRVTDCGH